MAQYCECSTLLINEGLIDTFQPAVGRLFEYTREISMISETCWLDVSKSYSCRGDHCDLQGERMGGEATVTRGQQDGVSHWGQTRCVQCVLGDLEGQKG